MAHPCLSCLVLAWHAPDVACAPSKRWPRRQLHPLQETFADLGAAQSVIARPRSCSLPKRSSRPIRNRRAAEIKDALAGNLCRCTGYIKIYEAVELAAARMRGEDAKPTEESLYGGVRVGMLDGWKVSHLPTFQPSNIPSSARPCAKSTPSRR